MRRILCHEDIITQSADGVMPSVILNNKYVITPQLLEFLIVILGSEWYICPMSLTTQDLTKIGELIDQKLDQKLDEKLDQKLEEFEVKMDKKMDQKFDAFESRIDQRLEDTELRLESKSNKKYMALVKAMNRIEKKLDGAIHMFDGEVTSLKKRTTRIEKHLDLQAS